MCGACTMVSVFLIWIYTIRQLHTSHTFFFFSFFTPSCQNVLSIDAYKAIQQWWFIKVYIFMKNVLDSQHIFSKPFIGELLYSHVVEYIIQGKNIMEHGSITQLFFFYQNTKFKSLSDFHTTFSVYFNHSIAIFFYANPAFLSILFCRSRSLRSRSNSFMRKM